MLVREIRCNFICFFFFRFYSLSTYLYGIYYLIMDEGLSYSVSLNCQLHRIFGLLFSLLWSQSIQRIICSFYRSSVCLTLWSANYNFSSAISAITSFNFMILFTYSFFFLSISLTYTIYLFIFLYVLATLTMLSFVNV